MKITLELTTVEDARRVIDFVAAGYPSSFTAANTGTHTATVVTTATPAATNRLVSEETTNGAVTIEAVKEAVVDAVKRIQAKQTDGNSNATAHVINKLEEVCQCKKVGDIPADKYADAVAGLNTLAV